MGQAVEPVPAQRPPGPPLARAARTWPPRPGWSRGTRCRSRPRRARRAARRRPRRARRATWAGAAARGRSATRSRRRTSASISTGAAYSVPPCTIRCPTASTRPNDSIAVLDRRRCRRAAARRGQVARRRVTSSSGVRTRSLRLLDPALTTQHAAWSSVSRPRPVPDLRGVLAELPGVRAARDPLVRHVLPHVPGRCLPARAPGRSRPSPGGTGPGR